jgi:serine-type D-Ala-D-Ala carboxypeptidase (penicillin-binding protein 5/6)
VAAVCGAVIAVLLAAAAAVLTAIPGVQAAPAPAVAPGAARPPALTAGPRRPPLPTGVPAAPRYTGPRRVYAVAGALADPATGQTLWSRDPDLRRPIGSIVKVMTALVVLQEGDLDRTITVTKAALRYVRRDGASSAGLIVGDVLTARQLLEAMLLPSGCDAAYLLATAYGPGRPAFVRKMNAMAAALGLSGTHFAGFDGMPFPTEWSSYSTPADLIRLGEAAMRGRVFRQIVAQRSYSVPATRHHHSYLWSSTDLMLWSYRGTLGIKTGDTQVAGDCFLFEARRDGKTLIGVVLHADPTDSYTSRFTAATRLLDWGFPRL